VNVLFYGHRHTAWTYWYKMYGYTIECGQGSGARASPVTGRRSLVGILSNQCPIYRYHQMTTL